MMKKSSRLMRWSYFDGSSTYRPLILVKRWNRDKDGVNAVCWKVEGQILIDVGLLIVF